MLANMVLRAVVLVSLLASHATAERVKDPACGRARATTTKVRTLRDIDWCNASVGGVWKGGLKAGRSEMHEYEDMGKPHDTIIHVLRGIVYGDLDGKAGVEAAIAIERTVWFASNSTQSTRMTVYIYGLARGKPALLGSIDAGTPVLAIALAKGIVTVTSGPANARTTQRYRRSGDDFEEVSTTK